MNNLLIIVTIDPTTIDDALFFRFKHDLYCIVHIMLNFIKFTEFDGLTPIFYHYQNSCSYLCTTTNFVKLSVVSFLRPD